MVSLPRIKPVIVLALAAAALFGGTAPLFWGRVQAGVEVAPTQGATAALWSGSIVLQNYGTEPATVVVNFYSTTGVLVKSHALPSPIPPNGTTAVDTEAIADLPNGFAGSAVVSANQPIGATFVGFDVTNPSINRTMYNGFADGANTVYVPTISNAYADQTSVLAVQNVDGVPASITIRYFERFTGAQSATVTDTLPASSSHFYDAGNLPGGQRLTPPWTGAALVQSSGGRVVAAVHQPYLSSNKAVAFEGTAVAGTEVYLPLALYHYTDQKQTTFISVQNTLSTPITVTTTIYATNGAVAGTATGSLQGFQKQSWNPGSTGVAPGFSGSAVVKATGPIAAVVNLESVAAFSMAYTGQVNGSLRQVLPYVRWAPAVDPKGWRTAIKVMNVDQILPADLTIRYYDQNGSLVQAPSFLSLAPNATVNHDPGMFIGDAAFIGTVVVEASRTIVALVNAMTVDGTQAESYTSLPIP